MSFVKLPPEELRRHKGTSFAGIGTIFHCYDPAGRLLLHLRSASARDEQGRWDVGGGGLKWGSTLEDNIRREIDEEYCATILALELWGHREVFRELDDGTPTHWLMFDYGVLVDPATVRIGDPGAMAELGWFTLQTLPQPLHSQLPHCYEKYAARYATIAADAKR
jgi:ADP-ribose pyrophosphatase YjhB (NUDIX family)